MFSGRLIRVVLAVVILISMQAVVLACPTCKDGIAQNDPYGANVAAGYFWSILFMMAMPFLIFGGLGTYFYLEIRKARARQAAGLSTE